MLQPRKVLLIDDSEEDRFTFRRYLAKEPCQALATFQLLETAYGSEGVVLFEIHRPDCVLLDFSLPDMDGLEVLRQLRDCVPLESLCVIVLTGTGDETVAVEALKNGASDYLTKGRFTGDQFCRAVENALEKTATRQALARQQALLYQQNLQLEAARQQLEQQALKLEASNADLERFAYTASHDLQEPLRTVEGFLNLLRRKFKGQLPPESEQYFQHMGAATTRMQQLIASLLEYARAGTGEQSQQEVALEQILELVRANLQASLLTADARLEYTALPVVTASSWQMVQLFQNLISNAIKFRSTQALHIQIEAQDQDLYWRLSVEDTGLGMAPEHTQLIFQPFKRLHSREQYEGSGIGLATCQKIVQNHGGTIWVESQPGKGSTFYFTLPKNK